MGFHEAAFPGIRYAPGPAYKYTSAMVYKYTRHRSSGDKPLQKSASRDERILAQNGRVYD